MLSRRGALALLLAAPAAPAALRAEAPARALRPPARPRLFGAAAEPSGAAILAAAGLSGQAGFLLADAASGAILEAAGADRPMPPASTAKVPTALYARAALGPGHRFATRLLRGPGGTLVLQGGGDPVLLTDDLVPLARAAAAGGPVARFLLAGDAIPPVRQIDAGQLPQADYNPALGPFALNFNRIHFEWTRSGGAWRFALDSRTETRIIPVTFVEMRLADRSLPVFTHEDGAGRERWTVASAALGQGGARWLPVRQPAALIAEVFAALARAEGLSLPTAELAAAPPADAAEIARHESPPLDRLLSDMLRYSTNITAETLGLAASLAAGARPAGLAESAAAMAAWFAGGGVRLAPVDHSGLGDASRIAPVEMVLLLLAAAREGALPGLLREIPMRDAEGEVMALPPGRILAKTGTLNFVTTLAGYLLAGGRRLAFAIFAHDPDRRAAGIASGEELPPGAQAWARAARGLQQALLRSWAVRFA